MTVETVEDSRDITRHCNVQEAVNSSISGQNSGRQGSTHLS